MRGRWRGPPGRRARRAPADVRAGGRPRPTCAPGGATGNVELDPTAPPSSTLSSIVAGNVELEARRRPAHASASPILELVRPIAASSTCAPGGASRPVDVRGRPPRPTCAPGGATAPADVRVPGGATGNVELDPTAPPSSTLSSIVAVNVELAARRRPAHASASPIPAHSQPVPQETHSSPPTMGREMPDQTAHRVLVVDDEPNIVDVLSMALRFQGFEVETAAPASEALAAVAALQAAPHGARRDAPRHGGLRGRPAGSARRRIGRSRSSSSPPATRPRTRSAA